MKNHYIKAVLELLRDGKDVTDVIDGLYKTLDAKGHTSLKSSVLRGVLVQLSAKSTQTIPIVVVASEVDIQKQTQAISTALKVLHAPEAYETVVNASIIGGNIATYNNVVLDNSYKTRLTNLYRSITK